MDALIQAAKREGTLVLPAHPEGSAGWIANIDGFRQRYGIPVTLSRAVSDADQVAAASQLDVLDLSPDVADANVQLLSPYLVFYWLEIPAALKQSKAYWYADCGGYMSIGYDPAHVPAVTTVGSLLGPGMRSAVSLSGDPQSQEGALVAVVMASVASGGSPEDVAPGVDFFHRLSAAGNLGVWGAAGAPPVVIDWDFQQPGLFPSISGWRYVVPAEAQVEAFRAQAISRFAPHPAAARLWEEYLFSDTGQNACLRIGARPSRMDAMRSEGTLDLGAAAALPAVAGTSYVLTASELAAAREYVRGHWVAAVTR